MFFGINLYFVFSCVRNRCVYYVCVQCVSNVSSLSLAIGYPTLASVPHSLVNGFKNLLSIAAVTDIEFEQAKTVSLAIV